METIRALVLADAAEGRRDLDLLLRRLSAVDFIGECGGPDGLMGLVRELDADFVLVDAERLPELLDPVDSERLPDGSPSSVAPSADTETKPPGRQPHGSRFVVKRPNGRVRFVPVSELLWIEAARDYVRLHTDAESHLVRETMSALEKRLDPREFVRVHRSTIVRLDAIQEIKYEASGRCSVLLVDGSRRPASRSGRRRLEGAIGYSA